MLIVDVEEAAERLEELVDRAVAGESIIISLDGKAVAKIVPYTGE
jgi:prevent-host-death family protein